MLTLRGSAAGGGTLSPAPRAAPAAYQQPAVPTASPLPESLLMAGTLFNFILCFVHTNLVPVGLLPVVGSEMLILGLALLVPFTLRGRQPGRMDYLLILLLVNWLMLSLFRQGANLKLFRDVAIIPVFVMLGFASCGGALHRRLFWLHMVILAFGIWEAISLTSFVKVFSVADFFASSRGIANDDWWIDNGLFLNSVRPEARFLIPSLPLHRVSSVFLEPVSMGNYVIISTIWLAGFWQQIPRPMRITGAVATVLLLIGSDSRMATVTCLAILLALPLRRRIPWFAPALTAPLVIAGMFLAVSLFGLKTGLDDFGGRIAYSVSVFRTFGFEDYAGTSLARMLDVQDAGFGYLIMSQSLIMVLILWASLFLRRTVTVENRFIHFAIATYLALNLTVSWSLFSIKTAALLWFLLGRANRDEQVALQEAGREPAEEPVPAAPPRPRSAYHATGGLIIKST